MNLMSTRTLLVPIVAAAAMLAPAAASADDQASSGQKQQPFEVIIYPILIEAPIFGASINLPSLPSGGGGGGGGGSSESGEQTGSTDVSLNTLYMAGVLVRADRWFVEARGQWADLTASRTTPRVTLDTAGRFWTVRGGVRLIGGLSAVGAVRRISGSLGATLELPALGKTVSGSIDPVLWDPMVGVDFTQRFGSLRFDANFLGGGFGVGTDADASGEGTLAWRFIRHAELRLGYGFFYYKQTIADVNIGSFQRTFVSSQTLHGPLLGIGIVF
jgi:hypothetical protein